jgi:hypothetical protein
LCGGCHNGCCGCGCRGTRGKLEISYILCLKANDPESRFLMTGIHSN